MSNKSKLILFLFTFILMVSSSCSSNDDDALDFKAKKEIIVMFSPGGLGDSGYNDLIFRGITQFKLTHPDTWLQSYSPYSMDDAQRIIKEWIVKKNDNPTLFVLAGSDYEPLISSLLQSDSAKEIIGSNKDILLFESSNDSLPIHTFSISMYGASFICGNFAQKAGCTQPSIILANPNDRSTWDAAQGFQSAWKDSIDLTYLSDDWTGYAMPEKAYEMMNEYAKTSDFVFCIAGGSNLGVYHYLREYPGEFYTAGMDMDQSALASSIIGSVIKRIDLVANDYLSQWVSGKELPHYKNYGLESGYVDWQPAESYSYLSNLITDNIRNEAIKKENEYFSMQ